jgi:hypothetical protein
MSHLKNHRRAGLGVWHPATKYKKTSKTWGPPATPQSHCCGRRAMTSLSKFNYITLRGPHQPTCVLTFYLIHMLTFFLTFYLLSGILSDLCSDMFPHWIRNSIWQCILHFGWNIYIYIIYIYLSYILLALASYLRFHLAVYLAFYLAFHIFWHVISHSLRHLIWYYI